MVGDLDGDGRAEVVVRDEPPEGSQEFVEVTALAGSAGAARWTWRGGDVRDPAIKGQPISLADFDGTGRREVCLDFGNRVEFLDAEGRERAGRERAGKPLRIIACTDLDGDDRDDLLLQDSDRLYACAGRPCGAVVPAEPRNRLPGDPGAGGATGDGSPRFDGRPRRCDRPPALEGTSIESP